ncbi:Pre-mRNA-splicing factor 18 [Tyrophagus putrescentiae]|nr:Pre-mRNA-splicing factor 18 [Tyrophagus putrescentiae]
MEQLKAELAKKRKLLECKSLVSNEKKFFKREELIRKEEEDYWKRQAEKEEQQRRKNKTNGGDYNGDSDRNEEELALLAKSPEEMAKLKLKKFIFNQSGANSSSDAKGGLGEERIMPRKDVIRKLRERNEPILLFGESEIDAFRRLRKYEILEPEAGDKGLRNDFQEAMEKVDAAYLEEIVKAGSSESGKEATKRREPMM